MYDLDTFLTSLYVAVDDFVASLPSATHKSGRAPVLCISEVITLSVFGQWAQFQSERGFYRWAVEHLRPYFPKLPNRSQFNRLARACLAQTQAFAVSLAESESALYQVVDGSGVAVRNSKRRGNSWLAGYANIGLCTRLGWYFGCYLLDSVTPTGAITGFCLGPASTKDQKMAQSFLAQRSLGMPQITSVGQAYHGFYVMDKGFSGPHLHRSWEQTFDVGIVCAPQTGHGEPWPKPWRKWLASLREIVETVHEKLLNTFRLDLERPHHIGGLLTRIAAKVGLHNFCIAMNRLANRANLQFADIVAW